MKYLSLFSGIEAATVAWHPLGWECVGVSEIEPFPCAVLAHHYPDVPNLGDVTKITEQDIAALGPIDIVVFGSPCQDLSVAGHRKGLINADGTVTRSGLFFTAVNIFTWARKHCGARFALWENVPGAFSSNKGRDFGAVVEFLAGLDEVPVPDKGWGTEGVALGSIGLVEWATLDAQWFGVAQRRRRVFALLDTGDWASRPPILLEPEGLRGDSAPRREAGEAVTNALTEHADCGGTNSEGQRLVPVAWGIRSANTSSNGWGISTELTHTLDQAQPHIVAFGGNNCSGPIAAAAAAAALNAHGGSGRMDFDSETLCVTGLVTHALKAEGFDASEDGTGRGQPIVLVAFSCKDYGGDASNDTAPTLRAMGHSGSHASAGGHVAVAFSIMPMNSGKDYKARETNIAQPIMAGGPVGGNQGGDFVVHNTAAVAFQSPQSGVRIGETHATLDSNNGVVANMQVRRLTPIECEKLQGFPSEYTNIPWRKQATSPDGPRYKALGNSMAVPVMRWIGQQIQWATDMEGIL